MAEGLARLAQLYKAELKEQSAKHLRAVAGMYSTEYEWVKEAYRTAKRNELEALILKCGGDPELLDKKILSRLK